MERSPVAVVIVTYQSEQVIAGCLTSLPDDVKVLVVDNASADDTVNVAAATRPDAQIIRNPVNAGFAAGVNLGIKAVEGHDVLVLNADARVHPGAIEALRAVEGKPIVVPKIVGVDGLTHFSLRREPKLRTAVSEALIGGYRAGRIGLGATVTDLKAYEHARPAEWATGCAWFIKRETVERLGLLDERYFLYSEEVEYMLRAGGVWFEPRAVVTHIGGEVSTNARLWSMLAANRVRLHRERHGKFAAFFMWLAVVLNEGLRARSPKHRAALRGLFRMRAWPEEVASEGPSYLCFSAQDWWYHNRAHSDFQLLRRVAKHRKVLLVNSIGLRMPSPGKSTQFLRRILRKAKSVAMLVRQPIPQTPNFYVMTPAPLPFYGKPWLRRLNSVLVRTQVRLVCLFLRMGTPVVVATIPTAWDVVEPMRHKGLIFNRSDRHSAFPEADQGTIAALENQLLSNSDTVLYVSRALQEEEAALTGERAHFLDHGVDVDHFTRRDELPADIASIPGPRIGFFGSLDDYLVDFDLIEKVAQEFPEASVVLIGDATCSMERYAKYPNVHWLDFRSYEQIPGYGSGFDVALMPWLDNDWIKHANPIKMKEYLALGLAVVSTDFPEVERYSDVIRIAKGEADFVDQIRLTLKDGGLKTPAERRAAVLTASWDSRARELMQIAEER
ncbi:glycosyltransferase [Lentzea nigeriaca]|uniref:glycosyltransferase n=1 Tax=Lentzea nigeriaca TaxID=1128665 RepID=UPI00195B4710|nr:glycosyltransferase [Lentzea nigeriaca]MBM7856771.1 GT2 family glycosyltransferase/glycosyltransferase involved in cell wall biosynthesis [Lentzea nigeriaca]